MRQSYRPSYWKSARAVAMIISGGHLTMAWYWPQINDSKTAQDAALGGVAASLLIAAITSVAATLSIAYHKPILGLDGWSLLDAVIFAVAGWRIYRMSRIWAVVGLLMYSLEVAWRFVHPLGGIGFSPVAIIFIMGFVSAVRGTFSYRKLSKQSDRVHTEGHQMSVESKPEGNTLT